jgi:hypothetical protein
MGASRRMSSRSRGNSEAINRPLGLPVYC